MQFLFTMQDIFRQIKSVIDNRELLMNLAFKDLKLRYRNPLFGFLWAFIMPLFTIIIFKLIFYDFMKIHSGPFPFFIYLMTAIVPWGFFQSSVSSASTSIIGSGSLIKKVYFPREIIPISIVIANLINLLPTLGVLLIFLVAFKMEFTLLFLLLPVILLLHALLTIGIALIVAGLQVRHPDVKYITEVLLMAVFYLTPAVYPFSMVSDFSQTFFKLYMLNPFVGLVTMYRIVLLGGFIKTLPEGANLFNIVIIPLVSAFATLFFGFWVFQKQKSIFADYI